MTVPTTLVVYRLTDTGERPLTVNKAKTFHHQRWGAAIREIRGRFHYLALEAKVPRLQRIALEVVPLHRTKASPQDVAACAPAAKAAVDGLVDAGVLADDDASHVASITFLPPDLTAGVDGMALRFWEVPA